MVTATQSTAAPASVIVRPIILGAVVEGGTDLSTPVTDDFTTELEKELEKARTAADRSPSVNGKTDTSEASSLAADVETDIRDVLGSVISKDTPRFDGLVRGLGNADFEARCDKAGVKGAVNAFIETNDKGEVLGIWIRKGSDNRQTLIHELLHAYVSSAFKSVVFGQSLSDAEGERTSWVTQAFGPGGHANRPGLGVNGADRISSPWQQAA